MDCAPFPSDFAFFHATTPRTHEEWPDTRNVNSAPKRFYTKAMANIKPHRSPSVV